MQNTTKPKRHSTTMREFRELEKRLLNLEREHNKLTKKRNFYCKSASSTRPYLSEKIAAKMRPQTAHLGRLNKEPIEESITVEKMEKSVHFEGKMADIDRDKIAYSTDEEREARPCDDEKKYRNTTRITSARINFPSRDSSANSRYKNRPPSVCSRHSSAGGRNSSATSRSLPSEFSHLDKPRHKSWTYHPMPIFPERQSIYTLVVPPVQVAEDRKRRLKKRKRQGGGRRHVAWIDSHEHVLRFQGIPREFYTHDKEHQTTECDMDKLKQCRYLR